MFLLDLETLRDSMLNVMLSIAIKNLFSVESGKENRTDILAKFCFCSDGKLSILNIFGGVSGVVWLVGITG